MMDEREARPEPGRPAATRAVTRLQLLQSASRLHIVLIAFLGTLTYGWLFSGQHAFLLALTAALDWLILDLGNKLSDLPEDLINNPREAGWVRDHQRGILVVISGLFLLSSIGTWLLAPALLLGRLVFQLGGVAYNFRVLPGRRRLKQIYLVKNASAALLFLITLVGYPLLALPGRIEAGWPYLLALSLFFFFFEMSYEVIYDFKDLAGDRAEGIPTYPARHGERVGRVVFDLFVSAAVLMMAGAFCLGVVGFKELIMVLAPGLQAACFELFRRRGYRSSDTVLITHLGSLQLLIYNAWVLLGLPIPP